MKKNFRCLLYSLLVLLVSVTSFQVMALEKPAKDYYQLTVYHYSTADQEKILDDYFEKALIPALHKLSLKHIGVFKALANDTAADKKIYVFATIKSPAAITGIETKLSADADYQSAGAAYLNVDYKNPVYTRKEVMLLEAFPLAPQMKLPQLKAAKSERVYELRSYESVSEKIFANKVKMFNDGDEIGLFARLNFNAIFYSSVIAGCKMPNLMYMTSFENMKDRDEHWKAFGADTYWKKLSSMPEYQNNVSHIDIIFLKPADYSDF